MEGDESKRQKTSRESSNAEVNLQNPVTENVLQVLAFHSNPSEELTIAQGIGIPWDILFHVFHYLSFSELLCVAANVSREWSRSLSEPLAWAHIDFRGEMGTRKFEYFSKLMGPFLDLRSIAFEDGQCSATDIMSLLAQAPNLECLSLRKLMRVVDDTFLTYFPVSIHLRSINLHASAITDAGLSWLAQRCGGVLPLALLNVSWTDVTGEALRLLRGTTSLDITGCDRVSDAILQDVIQRNPTLEVVLLRSCRILSDTTLLSLAQLPNLKAVNVCDIGKITDEGVRALSGCRSLESLNLRGCLAVTDGAFEGIPVSAWPKLVSLNVAYTQVEDAGLCSVARASPALQELTLTENPITDDALMVVAESCGSLRSLLVRGCRHISDESIKAVARGCPTLEMLDVANCSLISDVSMKTLAEGCPKLRRVGLFRTSVTSVGQQSLMNDGREIYFIS